MGGRSVSARDVFLQDVPDGFVRDALRLLTSRTKDATVFANQFSSEVSRDLMPSVRRAMIEDALCELAAKHGGRGSHMPNDAGTSNHVEVVFERTLITTHFVQEPSDLPRPAVFREHLADVSTQTHFTFIENVPAPVRVSPLVYAQLLYGPTDRRTLYPTFARIVFPGHTDTIDLTMRLSQQLYRQYENEEIGDDLQMRRRSKPIKKSEE